VIAMSESTTLSDDITAAFGRACREKDWQIAEFLLQALEALSERDQADEQARRTRHLRLVFSSESRLIP
jgi:hypothetical protein